MFVVDCDGTYATSIQRVPCRRKSRPLTRRDVDGVALASASVTTRPFTGRDFFAAVEVDGERRRLAALASVEKYGESELVAALLLLPALPLETLAT